MMPPMFMRVRIAGGAGRGFGLWIPLFLVWPLLVLVIVVALPFAAVAEAILTMAGNRVRIVGLLLWPMEALTACKGLSVDVQSGGRNGNGRVNVEFN